MHQPSTVTQFRWDNTDPKKWRTFKKHFAADLFMLIYFMSEVYALRDKAEEYFATMMDQMSENALLLYVDNNDSRFTDWFDGLAKAHGLEIVNSSEGWEQMPNHEDKSDLQPYLDKFGPPKLKTNIACRLARKPG